MCARMREEKAFPVASPFSTSQGGGKSGEQPTPNQKKSRAKSQALDSFHSSFSPSLSRLLLPLWRIHTQRRRRTGPRPPSSSRTSRRSSSSSRPCLLPSRPSQGGCRGLPRRSATPRRSSASRATRPRWPACARRWPASGRCLTCECEGAEREGGRGKERKREL